MPYIDQESRKVIDPEIDELIEKFKGQQVTFNHDALLCHASTRIVSETIGDSGWSYSKIARVVAVFECASAEFFRRIGKPNNVPCLPMRPQRFRYTDQESRDQVGPTIEALLKKLKSFDSAKHDGLLNYVVTRLALETIQPPWVYEKIIRVGEVFEYNKDEFYHTVAIPYEDGCILKNGDLEIYEAADKA